MDDDWQTVTARVVPGHGVASGRGGDPRFPGGSIGMQSPSFRERGLDLSPYHLGTVNVAIAPHAYRAMTASAKHTFNDVRWHPTEPAETFSFFDVRVERPGQPPVAGLVYYPHPDTKPAHFQRPDVLELLLPFLPGIATGDELRVSVPRSQIVIDPPD